MVFVLKRPQKNKKGTHNLSRDLPKCVKRYVDEKVRGGCSNTNEMKWMCWRDKAM